MRSLRSVTVLCLLAPLCAWGQARLVESAYVAIIPAGTTDVDSVLGLQRGIELVLCQSGIRPRLEGPPAGSELKLAASLARADFVVDAARRQIVRECELTAIAVTLPDGAEVPLPDLAISSRSAIQGSVGSTAGESFFVACGANLARSALDALKDKVAVRGSSCAEQPAVQPKKKRK
jgi:hypothetical protein